jgi:two-component system response regulator NreC
MPISNSETRATILPLPSDTIRVLLVDNRDVIREGLGALVDQQSGFTVVAQAGSIDSAKTLEVTPDVIVTEIDLPETRHVEVLSALRGKFPQSALLVLTLVRQPADVQSALAAGADGYLLKTATSSDLFNGIRALAAGKTYLQPSLGVELARWHRSRDSGNRLSSKEEQVLRFLALGHTNAEVAEQLGVSVRTIETHRSRIHQKLGCRTRAELVEHARNLGLFDLDPK